MCSVCGVSGQEAGAGAILQDAMRRTSLMDFGSYFLFGTAVHHHGWFRVFMGGCRINCDLAAVWVEQLLAVQQPESQSSKPAHLAGTAPRMRPDTKPFCNLPKNIKKFKHFSWSWDLSFHSSTSTSSMRAKKSIQNVYNC